MTFGDLPPEEVQRRHAISEARWRELQRTEWEQKYQFMCDKKYWSQGKCCAGCDHWVSEAAFLGNCTAAPIMSGADVMRSMGISFCSVPLEPGHPFTKADHVCGLFADTFDWSTLADDYLERIGAMKRGKLRDKP